MLVNTLLTVCILTVSAPCAADTLTVPGEYPTIQDAINAASDGDLIQVEAGLYVERLNPNGKEITVRGATDGSGDPTTIVDGNNEPGSVITINSGESWDSTIFENLVIRNGTGTLNFGRRQGGGIFVDFNDGALFENCHVLDNVADEGGGSSTGASHGATTAPSPATDACGPPSSTVPRP